MSSPESSILRILKGKSAVGAGFLAAERLAVTCAHVSQAAEGDVEGSIIEFDFPLIAPGKIVLGRVVFLDTNKDIAVIEIVDRLPKEAAAIRMVTTEDLWEHKFRAFGFPTGYDGGVWAAGVLLGRTADGWLHFEDNNETGFRVQPGFSGGPIWDEQLQAVIGMVVAAEQDSSIRAAFCIPVSVMIASFPGLKERAIPACPYRGLFAFREQDAALFFGRETFTASLYEAVQSRALVAVIGASGSGKSSVVFAGLLPKLRKDPRWLVADFRPGSRPFESLAAGLLLLLEPSMTETDRLIETRKLASALSGGDLQLAEIVERLLAKQHQAQKLILVADQFEELYTLCEDADLQRHFLDVMLAALNSQSKIIVTCLITLRADFMGQALTHRVFADALQDSDLKLGPMTPAELIQAIEKPAQLQGVEFESGLPVLIVNQIQDQPAALPLLEFALTQLWDHQVNGRLTLQAYQYIGGVEEALALYADQVYNELSDDKKEQARRIFIQLVHPGIGAEDTRRLAVRTDLEDEDWGLVRQLANLRLIVTDRTPDAQETVEVVHEALIREWRQLRSWMQTDRLFRAWQERLRAAMRQWHASQKDEGALLHGAPLAEAENWLEQRASDISSPEEEYINSSIELREREQTEKAERQRRELEAAQKLAEVESHSAQRARRLTRSLFGITLVAIGALIFSLLAYDQSEAHRVAALAQVAVVKDNPHMAAILGLQSLQIAKTTEASDLLSEVPNKLVGRSFYEGFPGELKVVTSVSWLSDRQLSVKSLDTASEGSLTIWDVDSGKSIRTLRAVATDLWSTAWSSDGRLASGTKDGTVILWDLETGKPAQRLKGHEDIVPSVAWSPDGRLASASRDGTVILWDLESGKPAQKLEGHEEAVITVAWSSDGQLASGSEDGIVIIWDLGTGEPALTLEGHEDVVNSIAWSPDGRLASGSADSSVILWDLETGEPALILKGHSDEVRSVAWSPDGQLASGSEDRTVILWDVETGDPAQRLQEHASAVRSVAWSPDGRLVSGSADFTAILWDLESGKPAQRFKEHEEAVTSVAWSSDERLASGSDDGTVILWDLESEEPALTLEGHEEPVTSVAWSPDGQLASGSEDGTVILWDLESEEPVLILKGHSDQVRTVAWSTDGRLASGSDDGTVILWNLETGKPAQSIKAHMREVSSVAWSPDGRLTTASWGGDVKVWDLEAGHTLITLTYPDKRVYSVAWSSDGRLASALGDGTVILWNLETGKPAQTLKEHSARAYSVAWSPDGRLASGSDDQSVIIWDLGTGKPAVRLMGNSSIESVAWATDGTLSYGSADWTVNVLNKRLTQSPCEWVGRNLSLAEWKENIGLMHDYRPACHNLPMQSIVPFSKDYFEFTLQGRMLILLSLLFVLAILIVTSRLIFRKSKRKGVPLADQKVPA